MPAQVDDLRGGRVLVAVHVERHPVRRDAQRRQPAHRGPGHVRATRRRRRRGPSTGRDRATTSGSAPAHRRYDGSSDTTGTTVSQRFTPGELLQRVEVVEVAGPADAEEHA